MLTSVLALVLGVIAVVIAMSMRSHIIAVRREIAGLSGRDTVDTKEVPKDTKEVPKDTKEVPESDAVEGFIDVPYTSGVERCANDPLTPMATEPPRDYIFTQMGVDNPYWDEEGYALEQVGKSDKENPLPKDGTGQYAKARVIGTEWEYTQCPACVRRYEYRPTV
jgi:hypothetical protein